MISPAREGERDVPAHRMPAIAEREPRAPRASLPAPACSREQPEKERRADERGEHAERDLDARRRPRQRVDPRRKPAPSSTATGSSRRKSGPTSRRATCGTIEADPADDPRDRDDRGGDERRRGDHGRADAHRRDAERGGLLVAERKDRDPPAQQPEHDEAGEHRRQGRAHVGGGASPRGCPSSQYVIAGSWLYGSARYFTSAMQAPSSAPSTTPASTSTRIGSWPRRLAAISVDRRHRGQAEHECEPLDRADVERQEDAEHRADRRAGRHAQDVGRHQRIAEQTLVRGARGGQRGADEQRGQRHAGRGCRTRPSRRSAGSPCAAPVSFDQQRREIAGRDRVAPDRERDGDRRAAPRGRRSRHERGAPSSGSARLAVAAARRAARRSAPGGSSGCRSRARSAAGPPGTLRIQACGRASAGRSAG